MLISAAGTWRWGEDAVWGICPESPSLGPQVEPDHRAHGRQVRDGACVTCTLPMRAAVHNPILPHEGQGPIFIGPLIWGWGGLPLGGGAFFWQMTPPTRWLPTCSTRWGQGDLLLRDDWPMADLYPSLRTRPPFSLLLPPPSPARCGTRWAAFSSRLPLASTPSRPSRGRPTASFSLWAPSTRCGCVTRRGGPTRRPRPWPAPSSPSPGRPTACSSRAPAAPVPLFSASCWAARWSGSASRPG